MEVAANEEAEIAFVGAVPLVDGELGEAWARLCGAAFPESAPKSGGLSAMPPNEDSAFARLTVEEMMSQLQFRMAPLSDSALGTAKIFA